MLSLLRAEKSITYLLFIQRTGNGNTTTKQKLGSKPTRAIYIFVSGRYFRPCSSWTQIWDPCPKTLWWHKVAGNLENGTDWDIRALELER